MINSSRSSIFGSTRPKPLPSKRTVLLADNFSPSSTWTSKIVLPSSKINCPSLMLVIDSDALYCLSSICQAPYQKHTLNLKSGSRPCRELIFKIERGVHAILRNAAPSLYWKLALVTASRSCPLVQLLPYKRVVGFRQLRSEGTRSFQCSNIDAFCAIKTRRPDLMAQLRSLLE